MENRFEKHIREKLQHREIQPSASAWERLSNRLDESEEKKKRGWIFYASIAASIALLLSVYFITKDKGAEENTVPTDTFVIEEKNKPILEDKDVKVEDVFKTTTDALVENSEEVKEEILPEQKKVAVKKKTTNRVVAEQKKQPEFKKIDVENTIEQVTQDKTAIVENKIEEKKLKDSTQIEIGDQTISVDSNALLASVTLSSEELRQYYKDYQISKRKVINIINKELKKNQLKIDPNVILAEVERDVNEESFQNNFYQFIRKRVSDVATAIANRNN